VEAMAKTSNHVSAAGTDNKKTELSAEETQ
jgi:hypothetical protein